MSLSETEDQPAKINDQRLKRPEVMLNLFASAGSSLLDPCQTCCCRFLAVASARSVLGLRAFCHLDKLLNASGLSIIFNVFFRSYRTTPCLYMPRLPSHLPCPPERAPSRE